MEEKEDCYFIALRERLKDFSKEELIKFCVDTYKSFDNERGYLFKINHDLSEVIAELHEEIRYLRGDNNG